MNLRQARCRVLLARLAFIVLLAAVPAAYAGQPCCNITAINSKTGVLTAKANATGQLFQFTLTNRAQLSQLKVGQAIYANLTNRQVSIDGQHPGGAIISITPIKAAPLDGIKTSAAPLDGFVTSVDQTQGIVMSKMTDGQMLEFRLKNPAALNALGRGSETGAGAGPNPKPVHVQACGSAGTFQYDNPESGFGGAHCPDGYFACLMPLSGQTSGGLKVCGATYVCMKGSAEANGSDCSKAGGKPVYTKP